MIIQRGEIMMKILQRPLLLIVLSVMSIFTLSADEQRYIEVSGTGLTNVSADYILISFSINTKSLHYTAAQNQNTRIAEKVFELLEEDYDVEERDITTLSYSLEKVYKYEPNRGQVEDGYEAKNSLQLKLKDFDRYKRLLTDLLDAGVDNITGVSFGIEDLETPKLEALAKALESARKKAQVLAVATGMNLGSPLLITEGTIVQPPRPVTLRNDLQMMEAGGGSSSGQQIISEGTRVIEARVQVRFEID